MLDGRTIVIDVTMPQKLIVFAFWAGFFLFLSLFLVAAALFFLCFPMVNEIGIQFVCVVAAA